MLFYMTWLGQYISTRSSKNAIWHSRWAQTHIHICDMWHTSIPQYVDGVFFWYESVELLSMTFDQVRTTERPKVMHDSLLCKLHGWAQEKCKFTGTKCQPMRLEKKLPKTLDILDFYLLSPGCWITSPLMINGRPLKNTSPSDILVWRMHMQAKKCQK